MEINVAGKICRVTKLLGKVDSNTKLAKSNKADTKYLTVGLSLSPANESGYQTCASSSEGCRKACLFTAGHGRFDNVRNSRVAKTIYFFEHRQLFLSQLEREISNTAKRAAKLGKVLAVRLNVVSDIMWEKIAPQLFEIPNTFYYDYTKHFARMKNYLAGKLPSNYHLTFSRSECNHDQAVEVLKREGQVAVVFDKIPSQWNGFAVVDGDQNDLRFLDPKCVIGLVPKGKAKKDDSGFVVTTRIALPLTA